MFSRTRILFILLLAGMALGLAPQGPSRLAAALPSHVAGDPGFPLMPPNIAPPVLPEDFAPLPLRHRARDVAALDAWVDAVAQRVATQDDPFAVIDACVEQEMAETQTPGASIAVAVDGELRHVRGYGVKHREQGGEIDAETLFRIGSTSKQLTAAAVMQLVEAGRVDLHAPVTTYLPDLELPPPYRASDITLHHLLTHSAGLADVYSLDWEEFAQMSLDSWASEALRTTPPNNPPGLFWNYSNPNFSLAGLVVETVSGERYRDYVARHLFEPLGMTHSTFDPEEATSDGNFAYGHQNDVRFEPVDFDYPAIEPAGSALSTPSDMVRWALALMAGGGGVLSAESARAMQAVQINTGYMDWYSYGYGIFVTEFEDATDPSQMVLVYDHGGNVPGYSSQLYWVPERGIAFSILANTMTSLTGSAYCALRELAHVKPHSTAGQTTPPETWGPFEGTYAIVQSAFLDITARVNREDSKLVLRFLDFGDTMPLVPVLKNTFAADMNNDGEPDSGLDWTFIRHPDDPNRVDWLRNRMLVGERVGQFPTAVSLRGESCAPFMFTAETDMPELAVRASGLSAGPQTQTDLPIAQTDPTDPTAASYKETIELGRETAMFFVVLIPQPDDNLELYLLRDANGDGDFGWPTELLAKGLVSGNNQRLIYLGGRPAAGRYQLWVHGTAVEGPSTFTLYRYIVSGDNLTVRDAPSQALRGQTHKFDVCASGTEDRAQPGMGFVELDYGRPPRRVRVPVTWLPEGVATPVPTEVVTPAPTEVVTPGPTVVPLHTVFLPIAAHHWESGQASSR